ncbi:glycosyltransferase [Oscillatoria sp. FACHB-1407]|uniref:glycosyltransferase family 2 protein n=1 Tax=Oscillatoria sp. FACHB-1407 TaxID=2692847 RepID=UPI001687444C|nr:glycosyltransferase family 2 protein [Oscillatoria sp. FACHB-1407]MBD2465156.1 glycosyltransferase [Oscillatoria sp. FACHB-1407]
MKQKATLITNATNGSDISGDIDGLTSLPVSEWLEVTQVLTPAEIQAHVTSIRNDVVIYLPNPHTLSGQMAIPLMPSSPFLMPWFPASPLPTETAIANSNEIVAWIASTCLVQQAVPQLQPSDWTVLRLAEVLERASIPFDWATVSALPLTDMQRELGSRDWQDQDHRSAKDIQDRSVLALVPHYRCEAWLSRCLRSLLAQTRPPDAIVVIDDASNRPPIGIVEQFPNVTLLAAPDRVGPYRLIQQVIHDTHYWGYVFQDADDWSSCDRLQSLLALALATGAELVGTQEIRIDEEAQRLTAVNYPLDANAALATKPGHPLLHPTSFVTRDLVQRLGGFATGLHFGGDTEFLLRAVWVAKVVNLPSYSYFRRKRSHSLTTAPDTGLESSARQALLRQLKQQAIARQAAFASGEPPDLSPIATAPAIQLNHITGPPLNCSASPVSRG